MNLRLTRPIVFVDLETTGTHPQNDRIVQIALIKIYPDGKRNPWQTYVNPEVPIPSEVTAVHGVTDELVQGAPKFRDIADKLAKGMRDCDVGGYNVKFDTRVLIAEFKRCRYPMEAGLLDTFLVDACRIYHHMYPRDLSAAVGEFLCEKHENAHDAAADIYNTARVLEAQLERWPELPRTPEELHKLLFETVRPGFVDPDGKFIYRNGVVCVNFSKSAGQRLDAVDVGFLDWIMKNDFSRKVKDIVTAEIKRRRDNVK